MSDAQERDEWLMAQVAVGARPPLETLVRRYATPLLTFITNIVRDRHRGEELFQEVFLAVWTKRRQYQVPRPFKPWLYAIALNKCRAELRRRPSALVTLEPEVAASDEPSPADTIVATETAATVAAAVRRLPAQQQTVVVLRVWQGLSYADIAAAMGRTEGTVRAHMHHALAALREHLSPHVH